MFPFICADGPSAGKDKDQSRLIITFVITQISSIILTVYWCWSGVAAPCLATVGSEDTVCVRAGVCACMCAWSARRPNPQSAKQQWAGLHGDLSPFIAAVKSERGSHPLSECDWNFFLATGRELPHLIPCPWACINVCLTRYAVRTSRWRRTQ